MTAEVDAGPLTAFLQDPDVTDVLVNGPGPVWVDRGEGVRRTPVVIGEERSLRRLAQRLVAACGRRLDDAMPHADARLPDGTRLHAVLPPVSPQGTCLSLRVPPRRTFDLADLVAAGSLPPAGAELLRRIVLARCRSWSLAARAPARPRSCRRCCPSCHPTSGSCWSRTPLSCDPPTRTSCGSRRGRPTPREPGRSTSPCWCVRHSGCVLTVSSSARCAAPRSVSCSARSTPDTKAAAARCTPTGPSICRPASKHSPPLPACRARPPTASSPPPWMSSCISPAVVTAAG